ncbi:MAG TPA: SpaA isopeptide-forming pilin-related protein [Bacilli bacterium]|nr:SpaA isopeptide-forming pilin-related protein [Bacilli bacterium]
MKKIFILLILLSLSLCTTVFASNNSSLTIQFRNINNKEFVYPKGIVIGIYNNQDKLITSITSTGESKLEYLGLPLNSNYYLKEISTIPGYKLNTNKVSFWYFGGTTTFSYYMDLEVETGKFNLTKVLDEGSLTTYESNVSFSIYTEENILFKKILTNDLGNASISLPYGSYYLKQDEKYLNYNIPSIYNFTINSNNLNVNKTLTDYKEHTIINNTYDAASEVVSPKNDDNAQEEINVTNVPNTLNNSYLLLSLISFLVLNIYVKKNI